jgi:hypothetical protein
MLTGTGYYAEAILKGRQNVEPAPNLHLSWHLDSGVVRGSLNDDKQTSRLWSIEV